MLDSGLFAVKIMKFSLTRFSKIQVYLFCLKRQYIEAIVIRNLIGVQKNILKAK